MEPQQDRNDRRAARLRALSDDEARALAWWLAGYAPEVLDQALEMVDGLRERLATA